MTLEVLFAREGQCAAFLRMCVIGLCLGALLHLSVPIRRRSRALGSLWDVLCCIGAAAVIGYVLLLSGAGVRLYQLLGLAVGGVLYLSGAWQAVRMLQNAWRRWRGRERTG